MARRSIDQVTPMPGAQVPNWVLDGPQMTDEEFQRAMEQQLQQFASPRDDQPTSQRELSRMPSMAPTPVSVQREMMPFSDWPGMELANPPQPRRLAVAGAPPDNTNLRSVMTDSEIQAALESVLAEVDPTTGHTIVYPRSQGNFSRGR